MAYRSKINPEELAGMDYKTYTKLLKKEIDRASAKEDSTEAIIFSDFEFADGTVATMFLLGKLSGPLQKFYKKAKKERKKEKDFAKGQCYFEKDDAGKLSLKIVLDDGKGKPNKMKKNGKQLFKRLGAAVDILKGALSEEDGNSTQELIHDELSQEEDQANDGLHLRKLAKTYQTAYIAIKEQVIGLLKQPAALGNEHFQLAKKAFQASLHFLNHYNEVDEKQQSKFADLQAKIENNHSQLKTILAKVKQSVSDGQTNEEQAISQELENLMTELQSSAQKIEDYKQQIQAKLAEQGISL